jgi:hypothetical protein
MPGGDRTGPMGLGPMTGRAAGYCGGYGVPGYMNPIPGRGFGGGFGRGRGGWGGGGRGWRHWYYATGLPGWARSGWGVPTPYYAPPTPGAEREYLDDVAKTLQDQLDGIKKRLDQLSTQDREKSE